MERSTDEGLLGDAAADRIVDLVDHRPVKTDLEVHAGTRAEATPTRLDVRRVDHPLGVVLTLGGELDLATVPVLQERLDHARRGKAAVVIDLSRLRFIDSSGLDLLVRAWILTSSSATPPSAALRTALVRRIESRWIPKPARTDRPRPSSTASSEE